MEQFNYIEEANVTMSDNFHGELVSYYLLLDVLGVAIHALKDLDAIKKGLFYGRQNDLLNGWIPEDIPVQRLHPDRSSAIRILHGIVGIATEAGEQLEALEKGLRGEGFDLVNISEEVGDNQWYAAAILRTLGTDFDSVQRTNIAKLRARFPDKFNERDANNRDLAAERAILEQPKAKPIVRIRDWVIIRDRLFGTALDHPKAPGGGESDVSTTTIVHFDPLNQTVETKNTLYQLVGPGVNPAAVG